jgi:hypothetical protein
MNGPTFFEAVATADQGTTITLNVPFQQWIPFRRLFQLRAKTVPFPEPLRRLAILSREGLDNQILE